MFEIKGKFNKAKIYASQVEEAAREEILNLCNQEWVKNSVMAYMPDVHACGDCCVGATIKLVEDKVNPRLIGSDFSCGMLTTQFQGDIDFEKLDNIIRELPVGRNVYDEVKFPFPLADDIIAPVRKEYCLKSLGTLGGGNHFIEVDKDKEGNYYLIIHTGCRRLGADILKHYANLETTIQGLTHEEAVKKCKAEWKASGKLIKDMGDEIKAIHEEYKKASIGNYIEGKNFHDYMHDVEIAQKFATRNREIIANHIISKMGWKVVDQFETAHNYIDTENMILRKGAVSAKAGERLLVPLNMRDGCVICIGKGVPEANYSCNHGAGRQLSRSAARANLSLDDFIEAMKGVYTTSVSEATLDEAPDAYKDSDVILNDMLHLVDIEKRLYTIYNFKGGQE